MTMAVPAPLALFLLGIPTAFAVERLIQGLTSTEDRPIEEIGRERLPWQREPWESRLRFGLALPLPFLLAVAALRFELGEALAVALLIAALLVCTATDLLRYRVPNAVTYPGVGLALFAAVLLPEGRVEDASLGALFSGGTFLTIWALTRGGFGLADVKVAVLIGAALGLSAASTALALGVIVGGIAMLILLLAGRVSRRQVTPYAPFLALSAMVVVFVDGTAFAPH
ncbi:MAG: hypothetical protein GEU75_10680 [Dehalococcoidia bacterium]|nr:hypothetical protein [Dehalococcoidia bacterium]